MSIAAVSQPHSRSTDETLGLLKASAQGLSRAEAAHRLKQYGPNALPRPKPQGIVTVFLRQFISPLIYILLAASVISLLLGEWSDALFIFIVLLFNAVVGTAQEYSAQRSAEALRQMVVTRSRVIRDNDEFEIDSEQLVPGDVVILESGGKVPADVRLLESHGLSVDESLLTGESLPVAKNASAVLAAESALGDRANMAFAGTLIARGRAHGVVAATGLQTEIGRLASVLLDREIEAKPPLLVRMEAFTFGVALAVGASAVVLFLVEFFRGSPPHEVFLIAVALAVAAIPEGLPVALTITLSVGMRRMARRHVIIRRLVAVEALGSCTCIASDKTGTLTVNQLTARRIVLPGEPPWQVTGEGMSPEGEVVVDDSPLNQKQRELFQRLANAAILCNEGVLAHRDGSWTHHGDAVDVALLVMARKAGIRQHEALAGQPMIKRIPYESERRFAASLHQAGGGRAVFVKGALERLLPMCRLMAVAGGDTAVDAALIEQQAHALAIAGFRVLAVASGAAAAVSEEAWGEEHLNDLTLLGLVGMIDPLRTEAKEAVADCRAAGIRVVMVTGDHPQTALSIARELTLADRMEQVVSGPQLAAAEANGEASVDALTAQALVFARVEPRQKLALVQSLGRHGHFVAVTGDGANDAPALRAAHVGVAMGRRGTDVARESAALILTDDNFASIVAGVQEGRVAYNNVRKVIFLLVSTGAAEIVLMALALFNNLPLPLLATQLLWLNLVTEGIQHIALAFDPPEGDEMRRPPRSPREPIFNRLMIERVLLSSLVMGGAAFVLYRTLLSAGWAVSDARNSTLLLMVLFENMQVFNGRSEWRSVLRHNPLQNPLLLFGVLGAQLVHLGAMYTPGLREVLRIQPISAGHWAQLLGYSLVLIAAMELHKLLRRRPKKS